MKDKNAPSFILHVSDFHLSDDQNGLNHAYAALKKLADELKYREIKVDYLIHTGDVIDSSDLYEKVVKLSPDTEKYYKEDKVNKKGKRVFSFDEFERAATIEEKTEFNKKLKELTSKRFSAVEKVLKDFISDLNISLGNVVICSGNHDILRFASVINDSAECVEDCNGTHQYSYARAEETFEPFETFLDNLEVANSRKRCGQSNPVVFCSLDSINVLILNTNWKNPEDQKDGYYCVQCNKVKQVVDSLRDGGSDNRKFNIVVAHKPIYEICERARLSYRRYIKTPFMAALQSFVGDKGIYFCGDKHTRSIVGSFFHDIPHYIGGEPLCGVHSDNAHVEYNLLEITQGQVGMERKLHLRSIHDQEWVCDLRPQDATVSKLYDVCRQYIIKNSFEAIGNSKSFLTWESMCQEMYGLDSAKRKQWTNNLNDLYQAICKYRINGYKDTSTDNENIFCFVKNRIIKQMEHTNSNNVLNVRGEYSSGKSTFLGLFYLYLLYQYSIGSIDFIPAYFNLESDAVFKKIEPNGSYHKATKDAFSAFTRTIQDISMKEHEPICYIIDGLDEQDCWSYSTEDSVGRGLLDVLSKYDNCWYIMAFSQHRLPCFKNTMPVRMYNDTSDIMYFNPIDVREYGAKDNRFVSFVEAFLKLNNFPNISGEKVEEICSIIRKFRRLTITPGFMYQNYKYITATNEFGDFTNKQTSVQHIYKYYIDRQYELCLERLGYGFVDYAPAIAYLFSFRGYTYEKLKYIQNDRNLYNQHNFTPILDNQSKVYEAFLFIKKHKDATEYLIALHYNRELRFYAENPNIKIDCNSILNQFISRNISVLVRKLWSDTNKFIIACEQLIKRDDISATTQSMLIYCLAHMQIYGPLRDQLKDQLVKKGEEILCSYPLLMDNEADAWIIEGANETEKLKQFIALSLKHSLTIFNEISNGNSIEVVKILLTDKEFSQYNRQYQMLYYGDLAIYGENKRRALLPGRDIIYKGFDFHNTFNYLYVKLSSNTPYPLREYDMYTMWNLISTRLEKTYLNNHTEKGNYEDTFFYRSNFRDQSYNVLLQAQSIFETYLACHKKKDVPSIFKTALKHIKQEIAHRGQEPNK